MTLTELDELLRAWGRAYGETRGAEWDEERSPTGDSPTARGLAFAPGTKDAATRRLTSYQRAGYGRRLAMAGGLAVTQEDDGPQAVPAWACDPVPTRETRASYSAPPRYDRRFTAELERVQTAWLALRGFNLLEAECLRVQYQIRGLTRPEKAELVGRNVRDAIGPKRFKDELRLARTWMHARLTA